MNREDIIRMAREASNNASGLYEENNDLVMLYLDELERFAALVAAAEREACAKVCEELVAHTDPNKERDGYFAAIACTLAIRTRSKQ